MCDFVKFASLVNDVSEEVEVFYNFFSKDTIPMIARAPGRINLIGEHIDYSGFCVFPMAIENDILILFTFGHGNTIQLRNVNKEYQQLNVDFDKIQINKTNPQWYDYFLSGMQGIIDYMVNKDLCVKQISMNVLVSGSIPPNAGLSSSSALVVCAALVAMKCFEINIEKRELAQLCAVSEQYVGTQGGGMDQCVSIMAQKGSALHIDFSGPTLQVEQYELPSNMVFVVTNSLQQMNKAASSQFNQRVMESRLSAKLLLKMLKPEIDHSSFTRMSDVKKELGLSLKEMLHEIETLFKPEYNRKDLIEALEISEEDFGAILSSNTKDMQNFQLLKRGKHIIQEAILVEKFKDALMLAEGVDVLGNLMNRSHISCRDLYQCSSEDLDELVSVCLKAGALGSRLTGAGWGGCVISLVAPEKVNEFKKQVAEAYYSKRDVGEKLDQYMFVTRPSGGASYCG